MTSKEASAAFEATEIDQLLAEALASATRAPGNHRAALASPEHLIQRIDYHGVAGLLARRADRMTSWPGAAVSGVRERALAFAMWELSHRTVLIRLLDELARVKIVAILLKGTAVAYDLYDEPATRARGDSDLLVDPADLHNVRDVLLRLGYRRDADPTDGSVDEFSLQEIWRSNQHPPFDHVVDLHWQLLNAPSLKDIFPFVECASGLRPLPRLSPNAFSMDRVRTLLHTCIHRAMHFMSPYIVNSQIYYGGDRLIWLNDIHLLAGSLSPDEWTRMCQLSKAFGVSSACLDGLVTARRLLASPVPEWVIRILAADARLAPSETYLTSSQFRRAWQDWKSIEGLSRKLGYLRARAFPPAPFMRGKYPHLKHLPLPLLYARRLMGLVRKRIPGSAGR